MSEAKPATCFIVFDTAMGQWISGIDTYDGDVSHTGDMNNARFFRGPEWHEFWSGERYLRVEAS